VSTLFCFLRGTKAGRFKEGELEARRIAVNIAKLPELPELPVKREAEED